MFKPMEPTRQEIIDILSEADALARQYIDECGGCDHSVGICMCVYKAVAFQINLMFHRMLGDAPMCPLHGLIDDEICWTCFETMGGEGNA